MDRSLLAVLAGTITVVLFTLLAGLILLPVDIRMWFIPLGFILACLIIGVVGRFRVLHLLLLSFIIYLGLMVFLAIGGTLLVGVQFPPLHLDAIIEAWTVFQTFVNLYIPFLMVLSDLAAMLRTMTGGSSILAIFLEFFVASAFIGIIGLLLTGVTGFVTRDSGLYVVSAPEPTIEVPSPAIPAAPAVAPVPTDVGQPPQPMPDAPPPMPAPHAVEEASPPPPPSEGGSPSAKAISSLKGKVKKHLKGTGQKVPAGQSRCPHCNATIIRGSRFCNACEKAI